MREHTSMNRTQPKGIMYLKDAYGDDMDLQRWARVRIIDNPGSGREHDDVRLGCSGSLIAITNTGDAIAGQKVAVLTDAAGLVEVYSTQIVEDDEMPIDQDVCAEIEQAQNSDHFLGL